ncbi:cutinase-domain-containing protein [Aspergillus costaricaensis CBS 115574]|uniref:Cutinase-domain-containing protein n=1 Tax=Aspergillus costaricaensis CBS 115574 TaxID=1448317 RepID=A0ACD1I6G3_9EURO|nr:cutinase-domain-containing protein [Aspergillus costaricaensis CBS 115574]RAK85586.1 cutinase-domain-containing protein [Aspergillus costaricaensis CBS 115574]
MAPLKSLLLTASLATLAISTPLASDPGSLYARQFGTGSTANELEQGSCKDVTLIFARGSTELGNMGTVIGPPLCDSLKSKLGSDKVACQGVGGQYSAGLVQNALPQNTDPGSISAAKQMFEEANSKCPNTKIVAGGYSQGSAVIDNAVQEVSSTVRDQIKGVVLFGFTRNVQDHGQIPNYPKDDVKVYCAVGDLVCDDTLIVTAMHLTYGLDAGDAASFLAEKVQSSTSTSTTTSSSSSSDAASSSSAAGGLASFFGGL